MRQRGAPWALSASPYSLVALLFTLPYMLWLFMSLFVTLMANSGPTRAVSITTTPGVARRVRAACRSTAHRRALTGGAATGPATTAAGSAISDPRIDPAIQEIHEQVAHDEADGDEQDHALHERIGAREDGGHHPAPHAGPGEPVPGDG